MEFGPILIRLRSRSRFTQKEIADKLDIAQSTYNTWESGQTSYKVEFLPKLAATLGVRMRDLLPPEPGDVLPTPPTPATDLRDDLILSLKQTNALLTCRIVELEKELAGRISVE